MAKLGPPLKLTNKQIAEMAEITDEDVTRVTETWQRVVPSALRNLLLTVHEDSETPS